MTADGADRGGAAGGAGVSGGRVDPEAAVRCPNCGTGVDASRARRAGELERVGCPACALQLVRRPGGEWAGIRG